MNCAAALVAATVLFSAGTQGPPSPQQIPTLAGEWTADLDGAPSESASARPPGPLSVTQTTGTVVFVRAIPEIGAKITLTYTLDGKPSRNLAGLQNGQPCCEVVSMARWDGATLVITSESERGPQTETYALEAGRLVHTLKFGREGAFNRIATITYRRAR